MKISTFLKNGMVKRTAVYTLSGMFSALINFLLLPIFTRHLSQYDYGVMETVLAIVGFLTGLLMLGSTTMLAKEYFKMEGEHRAELISHILGVIVVTTIVAFVISSLFHVQISQLVHVDSTLVLLAVGIAFMSAVINVILVVFQLEKNAKHYAFMVNIRKLLEVGIALVLVLAFGLTWQGTVYGFAISSAVFLVVAYVCLIRRDVNVSLPKRKYMGLLVLGAPLAIAHISAWSNEMVGKLMINGIISVDATGLYSVGYRFGMLIMMVEVALSRAWLPFFYERIQTDSWATKIRIVKATYLCAFALLVLALIVGFGSKYLLYLMVDPKFYGASAFILIISVAYAFDGIWKLFLGYLVHENKTNYYTYIIVMSAVVNVVLNYVLLKKIGLMGAAWSTLASFAVGALVTMLVAVKIHPMPWLYFLKRRETVCDHA